VADGAATGPAAALISATGQLHNTLLLVIGWRLVALKNTRPTQGG
jgi:hypothetical protein